MPFLFWMPMILMRGLWDLAEENARMEWDGVPISRERLIELRSGLGRAVRLHRTALIEAGLANPKPA